MRVFLRDEQDEGKQSGKDGNAHTYIRWGSKDSDLGEQLSDQWGSGGEQAGEQSARAIATAEYIKDESVLISSDEDTREHLSDKQGSSEERSGEQAARFPAGDEYIEDDRRGSSDQDVGEQLIETDCDELADEQASQWLKAILPEMTNGWWDVYPKGRGFAVKFCWRDQERQTLTFPRISYEQFQTLKQGNPDEVGKSTYGQISAHLQSLSLNSARRDKALIVAQKLGIDLDEN